MKIRIWLKIPLPTTLHTVAYKISKKAAGLKNGHSLPIFKQTKHSKRTPRNTFVYSMIIKSLHR